MPPKQTPGNPLTESEVSHSTLFWKRKWLWVLVIIFVLIGLGIYLVSAQRAKPPIDIQETSLPQTLEGAVYVIEAPSYAYGTTTIKEWSEKNSAWQSVQSLAEGYIREVGFFNNTLYYIIPEYTTGYTTNIYSQSFPIGTPQKIAQLPGNAKNFIIVHDGLLVAIPIGTQCSDVGINCEMNLHKVSFAGEVTVLARAKGVNIDYYARDGAFITSGGHTDAGCGSKEIYKYDRNTDLIDKAEFLYDGCMENGTTNTEEMVADFYTRAEKDLDPDLIRTQTKLLKKSGLDYVVAPNDSVPLFSGRHVPLTIYAEDAPDAPITKDTPKGTKVYRNDIFGFEFTYPEKMSLWENDYSPANWSQLFLALGSGDQIEVYAEDARRQNGNYFLCHWDLCDKTPLSQKIAGGEVWDYLGYTNYCEGEECATATKSATFRTRTDTGVIYVHAPSTEAADIILDTLKFI